MKQWFLLAYKIHQRKRLHCVSKSTGASPTRSYAKQKKDTNSWTTEDLIIFLRPGEDMTFMLWVQSLEMGLNFFFNCRERNLRYPLVLVSGFQKCILQREEFR